MDLDPLNEYALSAQLTSDGEPVRCCACPSPPATGRGDAGETTAKAGVVTGAAPLELLSGSQGGVVTSFILRRGGDDGEGILKADGGGGGGFDMTVQPGGPPTRHPHHITALLPSPAAPPSGGETSPLPSIYVTGCKDGKVRIMDGATHELRSVLEGHTNAVTSLSWITSDPVDASGSAAPWLVTGSWDGTAKVWDGIFLSDGSAGRLLGTLGGHENTVSVAGLPPSGGGVRRVATGSAGVAEGNVIRDHAVRIWELQPAFASSGDGTTTTTAIASNLLARVANDHSGPIRDLCHDPDAGALYTCSNDGTVKVRSDVDGSCLETLAYPGGSEGGGPPMLLSVCVVEGGGSGTGKAVVAGTEDGNAVVWDLSGSGREPRVIAHPGCVWNVSPVVAAPEAGTGTGEFVTACNDGHVRIFTRDPAGIAPASTVASFESAVSESRAARSSGPSPDEIAKLPKWEMNALQVGRSEGQVQVFNKGGTAVAAQWSEASRTWIEVGEVTGTNQNAGAIDGQKYDHVLPIEIDVPGGGVQTLQIGYNNGDNPFVTAQTFMDEHMLDQNYLAQIADYIRQRAGAGAGPTLGMEGGGAAGVGAGPSSSLSSFSATPMEVTPAYEHLPMKGYKTFDAGADKKVLSKVLNKLREFNSSSDPPLLADAEAGASLDDLVDILSRTNRYHSSSVPQSGLDVVRKITSSWDATKAFPAVDLARLAVLHPDAARSGREAYWTSTVGAALDRSVEAPEGVACPMLAMRLIANCCRGGPGSAGGVMAIADRFLECAEACADSNNKNVRLSIATALLNVSSHLHSHPRCIPAPSNVVRRILETAGTILGSGKYESEAVVRVLVAVGTVLLVPGCEDEAKAAANGMGVSSMVERIGGAHGDRAGAVAGEIRSILTR